MKTITRAKLLNGEVLTWTSLLKKYKIHHSEGKSAHVEWNNEAKVNKKLPKIKVVTKNGINYEEFEDKNYENNGSLRITKRHKQFVWKRDVGDSKVGKCYVCNSIITDDNFETGHIIAKSKNGINHVSNLRAVCIPCNKAMGTSNLDDFKKDFEDSCSAHNCNVNSKLSNKEIKKLDNDTVNVWKNSIRLLKELKSKIGHNDYKNALTVAINSLELNIENF